MNKILLLLLTLFSSCKTLSSLNSTIKFSSDLQQFSELSTLKKALKNVDIIALGENTHGLGTVFKAKTELVKFLHQELGFDLVLFESGFGDGALAWEQFDSLSSKEFTNSFSSNFYYNSEEIEELVQYVKSQNKAIKLQGFDCQPQQNYLIKRMTEIIYPVDSTFAKSVQTEMRNFNNLYQLENNNDTLAFYKQRDNFISFLTDYEHVLNKQEQAILNSGTTKNEIDAIKKSNAIFKDTYAQLKMGEMMGWPAYANIRDQSLYNTIKWFKEKNPKTKIIIWAQNSHIENEDKPGYNVKWMGHHLKATYGDQYYSVGAIVYSGTSLNYNGTFDFEHKDSTYLAYHLNQFQEDRFVLNLRNHNKEDCTKQLLLGMESGGSTARFVAKNRFDGLLFIKFSDPPKLIKGE